MNEIFELINSLYENDNITKSQETIIRNYLTDYERLLTKEVKLGSIDLKALQYELDVINSTVIGNDIMVPIRVKDKYRLTKIQQAIDAIRDIKE